MSSEEIQKMAAGITLLISITAVLMIKF